MRCVVCNSPSKVLETRTHNTKKEKKRRYECFNNHRFSTLETIIETETLLHKKQKIPEISKHFTLSNLWNRRVDTSST